MTSIIPDGQMVYGMQLPVQSQSKLYAEDWEESAGVDELAALARAADRAGLFYVAVCDHVAIPRGIADRMGTTWYDTMTTLGFLAGITESVRLMTHVTVPAYRHPLMTSKAIATLDELSKGRAILGVGAGHLTPEFDLLKVDFHRRGSLLDEAIDVIDAALREEFPEVDGPTWPARDFGQRPRPRQQPRPPIWIGGSARPSLRRAAEKGDGWLPQGTPRAEMPEQIAYLRDHRAAVRPDDAIDIGTISEFLYVGTPSWDVGEHCIAGPPERLAEGLREFKAMGVNHCQVRFRSRSVDELVDQITAFGAEVAPLVE